MKTNILESVRDYFETYYVCYLSLNSLSMKSQRGCLAVSKRKHLYELENTKGKNKKQSKKMENMRRQNSTPFEVFPTTTDPMSPEKAGLPTTTDYLQKKRKI
jgi:hypothetical protein